MKIKITTTEISHPSDVMLTISTPFCFAAAAAAALADDLSDFVTSTLASCTKINHFKPSHFTDYFSTALYEELIHNSDYKSLVHVHGTILP